MATNKVVPINKESWLELRTANINSTEVSALFNMNPYMSAYELGLLKSGKIADAFEETERMKWGTRLQDAIARGVAEDLGFQVRKLNAYYTIPDVRMGSSFDFEIVSHDDGPGLMEIKNVDKFIYRNNWTDEEAPAHIELQVQHQMEVADREWAIIVALVGGNEVKIIHRKRDRTVGAALRKVVSMFWENLANGILPEKNFEQDSKFIISLYGTSDDSIYNAVGDEKVSTLAENYNKLATEVRMLEKSRDAAKAELLTLIGEAGKVIGDSFTITTSRTKDSAGTLITQEMVGTTIGGRSGYRQFKFTQKGAAE